MARDEGIVCVAALSTASPPVCPEKRTVSSRRGPVSPCWGALANRSQSVEGPVSLAWSHNLSSLWS
jgi:hypothetical protein